MALRTALGARRRDLVRQLLVETGLLSLFGGALGFLVALGGVRALLAFGPEKLPRAAEVSIHPPVLIFNLVLALAVGLALGIVPAFQGGVQGVGVGLRGSGRGETEGRRGSRARAALIAVEVGLSLVLLVGAGLLLRTLGRLQDTSPGFDPERVLAVQISLPKSRYGDPPAIGRYADEIATRLSRLPGVTHAAAASLNPLTNWRANISYTIDGRSELTKDNAPIANYRAVAPGYFESLGVPLIDGRDVSAFDKPDSPPVLLVTETLAKRHFPGGKAVGARLRIDDVETWRTVEIIGVVGDTRHYGLDTDGTADVFVPYPQVPPHLTVYFANIFCIAVRTAGDPGLLATTVRREITALDRDVAITSIRPMSEAFDASLADRRFYTALLQVFGLAALALALAGIYSVTSFSVVERTREIGVRLSLGSSRGGILRLIVRRAMLPVAAGLAVGVVAARMLGRLMSGLLVGVPHSDIATFLAAGILLAVAAVVASVVPALRATRIDPVRALRAE
jgi:predicted permease